MKAFLQNWVGIKPRELSKNEQVTTEFLKHFKRRLKLSAVHVSRTKFMNLHEGHIFIEQINFLRDFKMVW